MMVYWPSLSVTAVRAPSMSTGLEASTVTPGSTPPVASVTRPAIWLCADAPVGSTATHASATQNVNRRLLCIPTLPLMAE
jgi:hypothetical protein